MKRPYGTVTQDMVIGSEKIVFSVSVQTPGWGGQAAATLHVGRWITQSSTYPGTVTVVANKPFNSADEAWDWAFEHGYIQPYFNRTWCRKHRKLHVSGQYDVPPYNNRPAFTRINYTPTCMG